MRKIVVGLGNPGARYAGTRHNIGWMVLDRLADRLGVAGSVKSRDAAATVRGRIGDDELVLVKPMTYMNLSGEAVRKALAREHTKLADMLIVVDEMALPFGKLRMRAKGSDGGHNGLRSIVGELGTQDFARLRIGIGAPSRNAVQHVLGDFEHAEQRHLDTILDAAADAVELWATEGPEATAGRWNSWTFETDPEPSAGPPPSPGADETPQPDADGIVRTRTGWRRLLPHVRSGGEDRPE